MAEQNAEENHAESLLKFAFFPRTNDCYQALAELAEREDWSGTDNTGTTNIILKNYIKYTYERLRIQGKIVVSTNRAYATFNTGLLTPEFEEIFGIFEKNEGRQLWCFKNWVRTSDISLMSEFTDTPEMATYVDSAADLVYDTKKGLDLNVDHILNGNIERFPLSFKSSVQFQRRAALNFAKETVLKRLRRNYKLANTWSKRCPAPVAS